MKTCIVLLCILTLNMVTFTAHLAEIKGSFHTSSAQAASSNVEAKQTSQVASNKSHGLAIFLAMFFGIHQFYIGNYVVGISYIILTLVFGIGWIFSLIDCCMLIAMTEEEFHRDVLAGETWWSFRWLSSFFGKPQTI